MSTISALGAIAVYKQQVAANPPTTAISKAQQTVTQTPAKVVSQFVPTNTSFHGTAPAVNSLLGNVSTSASLKTLAQIQRHAIGLDADFAVCLGTSGNQLRHAVKDRFAEYADAECP